MPFTARMAAPEFAVLGDVLADEMISALSRSTHLHVISHLSTSAFRGRDANLSTISSALQATYVLSGGFVVANKRVALTVELAEAATGRVLWGEVRRGEIAAILNGDDPLVPEIVEGVSLAIVDAVVQMTRATPLPNLAGHSLLLGAISLMHRASRTDFERAEKALTHLAERHRRVAAPHAWIAKWNVLCVTRGWVANSPEHAQRTLEHVKRALDADPNCSLGWAMQGFVQTHLLKDLSAATLSLEQALNINPNESLAWLFSGVCHAFRDDGATASADSERALTLSPLDPLRYYYDSLSATAALAAGNFERARDLALRSLRANRTHTSTWRALTVALVRLDDTLAARRAIDSLLVLDPQFSVSRFAAQTPSRGTRLGADWVEALLLAGAPR
jgi:TolB-like protein/tetratricopeptide (TPR) repeat protein